MKSLILSAFCILTLLQFSCNNNHANSKITDNLVKISDQGVNISYTDSRSGDTTLLFVHGWCINKTYWANQIRFFNRKYRVVTVDLPGFGKSGKNRTVWSMEAYGRDIDTVISQLHLKNVILVGHSMAGDIIVQAAINSPGQVIGLVGVDNFKNVGHLPSKKDKQDFDNAIVELKHHFKQIAFQYFSQDLFYKTTADSIKKRILNDVAKADTVIATATMVQGNDFDEVKKMNTVKKKLYLINSDYTPTETNGFNTNHIPYQVFYIHATGHFPMIEKPLEFNAALSNILTKL